MTDATSMVKPTTPAITSNALMMNEPKKTAVTTNATNSSARTSATMPLKKLDSPEVTSFTGDPLTVILSETVSDLLLLHR